MAPHLPSRLRRRLSQHVGVAVVFDPRHSHTPNSSAQLRTVDGETP
nr:MAG TPA: hypothetical protein [Caudoviricetes sp.]